MIAALSLLLALAPGATEEYQALQFMSRNGKMPYRLLRPEHYDKAKKYPLVLILHGWGERGTDNSAQLKLFGPVFLKPAVRQKFPCFVLVPQANGSWIQNPEFEKPIPLLAKPTANIRLAVEILDRVKKQEAVDPDRLYLMGPISHCRRRNSPPSRLD
jgi:predicted peptidase